MVFNDANGWSSLSPVPLNTGVLCHEMSHTLGTYDLYHVNDNLNPVGVWDLMSDNLTTPQQMSAYTKYRYCKWIDEIPEGEFFHITHLMEKVKTRGGRVGCFPVSEDAWKDMGEWPEYLKMIKVL
jgi:bacillopeptidase F (M6 metalloprotease family)